MKIFYDQSGPESRALVEFLRLNKIPFDGQVEDTKNENRLKEIRLGQLPMINDEGFQVTEVLPIIRYLVGKHPIDDHWYPKDAKRQARIDEFFSWAAHNMHTLGENSECPEMPFHRKFQGATESGHSEELKKKTELALDELENLWMESEFITGSESMTIADLFTAFEVTNSKNLGVDPWKNRPKLSEWFKRIEKDTGIAFN